MQVKLLRVIQEKEVLPLGATAPVKIDVRFIAATNRDVQDMVKQGGFRQDLYFRLNVVNLHIPPCRARKEDVPLLAHHFLLKHAALMGKDVTELAPDALDLLQRLRLSRQRARTGKHHRARRRASPPATASSPPTCPTTCANCRSAPSAKKPGASPPWRNRSRTTSRWVLQEAGGNQTLAAQILGIDRVSLWRKLKRYEVEKG